MPSIKKRENTAWVKAVAASYGKRVGEIAYIFVDDEKILEVNRQYLGHDYYTDIITFDYCEGDVISGDLFISLDTVRTNAEQVGATYEEELHRVIIHGILHLCGINDKGPGEREIMEAAKTRLWLCVLHWPNDGRRQMWKTLLCVGAGSFVGGMARYGLTRWVSAGNFTHLPLGTMVVNVAGCLFIGLLYGWFERADVLSPEWRLFLTVGFCGGFTTFSTFVHENYILSFQTSSGRLPHTRC